MVGNVTTGAVRQMRAELDRLEAQAKDELKNRNTRGLGVLRLELVEECRRKLFFISLRLKRRRDL